jgi:alanyl-tRNA synthetase
LIVHRVRVLEGRLSVGQEVLLQVDEERRWDTARNHSATHILQSVLREVLGEVVQQSGSKVTPEGFRFDYTYPGSVDMETLARVERRVNQRIRENHPVSAQHLPYREALSLGAIALFDEKYGDVVRVVQMGDFSMELCGGTHTRRTGDVGFFKVLSDRSISADTRRIEALTGRAAVEYVQELERSHFRIAETLKATPEELPVKVERLLERQKALEREIRSLQAKLASGQARDLLSEVRDVAGIRVLAAEVPVQDVKTLGEMSDRLRDRLGSGIVLLGARSGSKAVLTLSVSQDLQDRFPAGELIREVAGKVGGKGGGRPRFAQGGGPEAHLLPQALSHLYEVVAAKAGS